MKNAERGHLARFVAQRMELGDMEWNLDPAIVSAVMAESARLHGSRTDAAPPPPELSAQEPEGPGLDPACGVVRFDVGELAGSDSIEALNRTVCNCKRCPLGETRTRFVFGDGNPDAGMMFVGEAPGADEDAQGLPFVGRAGKLLTKMIAAIKMQRSDVYIGNILKCRPAGNRDPKPDEIEACEPILLRQIDLIRPKVICALGRIAGQTLLRTKASLGSLRGTVHDYHGVKLIVTYHPAALLRNPNWKPQAWEDLKFARREYDGMEL